MSIMPGQVIYWTADTWHVAEDQLNKILAFSIAVRAANDIASTFLKDILIFSTSSGAQSLTLSDVQLEFIHDMFGGHVEREVDILLRDTKYGALSISGNSLQELAQKNPVEIESIAKKLKAVFSKKDLELIKSKFWLKILTSYGITQDFHRKCPTNILLDLLDTVRLYQNIPLLWKEYNQNILIAATGKLFCVEGGHRKKLLRIWLKS